MPSVLDAVSSQFEADAVQHDATAATIKEFLSDLSTLLGTFAATVSAAAQSSRDSGKNIVEYLMANAAALVAEATARILANDAAAATAAKTASDALAAEQAKEADLQTALDAANAQIAALTPNVVPADEVAALDAALHPVAAPVDGSTPVAP